MEGHRRTHNCPPTKHELEVFAACLRNRSGKVAAHELHLGYYTVKHTLERLYIKLDADCYTDAAIRLGWLVIPDLDKA
jgi:DNA-binding NarL/FixJ family response regulator